MINGWDLSVFDQEKDVGIVLLRQEFDSTKMGRRSTLNKQLRLQGLLRRGLPYYLGSGTMEAIARQTKRCKDK